MVKKCEKNCETVWKEKKLASDNYVELEFDAIPENEGFARVVVAAFMAQLDPLLEEVDDVKTAVSEAVTNCIIHGYGDYNRENKEKKYGLLKENDSRKNDDRENCKRENATGENHNTDNNSREKGERDNHKENANRMVHMECFRCQNELYVLIEDTGIGIEDVKQAMEPLFTTKPDMERSGMGFAFMEAFMDELCVESQKNMGTKVYMSKRIGEK
ncbi:MAG: anti-sigma F factor [Lachnospiraceae bacterium]|nr:anti-sigma F factor [Lachnospiraceae bacterium]